MIANVRLGPKLLPIIVATALIGSFVQTATEHARHEQGVEASQRTGDTKQTTHTRIQK